ncbi:MAG TPA: hypothetical protein VJ343_00935 [archaeon]|nr:hypothetical protein [archaeon]
MADFKIRIPNRVESNNRPEAITVPSNINEKAISATIEAARNNDEATEKLTSMVMESLDVQKFKERLVEEALRDPELRTKVMLELLRKL